MTFFSRMKAKIQQHWRSRAEDEMTRRGEPASADFGGGESDDFELHPPGATANLLAVPLAEISLQSIAFRMFTAQGLRHKTTLLGKPAVAPGGRCGVGRPAHNRPDSFA
jgi:hypothetical protein